jgi:hypothetical protein
MLKKIKTAILKLEDVNRYLQHCQYKFEGRSLNIVCSERVVEKLLARLDTLVLCFEAVERIIINGRVVYDVPLPKIKLGLRVVEILKPSKKLCKKKYPVLKIKI